MKRKPLVVVMFILIVLLCSGCEQTHEAYSPLYRLIDANLADTYHTIRRMDQETPYTLVFENVDGTSSVYIFSSPISYKNQEGKLELMDSSLTKTTDRVMRKKGYSLENKSGDIKTYFPEDIDQQPLLIQGEQDTLSFSPYGTVSGKLQKSTFTDVIGRPYDSAIYPNSTPLPIEYIPTDSGIMTNIIFHEKPETNELKFFVTPPDNTEIVVMDNQYIVFYDPQSNVPKALVYPSFLRDSNGNYGMDCQIDLQEHEDEVMITWFLDDDFLNDSATQYPLTISPSFALYRNSQPDSTIYSKRPSDNYYLSDYAILSNRENQDKSLHYLRFRVNYFFGTYAENIKSARYVPTLLGGSSEPAVIEMLALNDMWGSTSVTWKKQYPTYGVECQTEVAGLGQYEFDITEFIKRCVRDDTWTREAYGLAMHAADGEAQKIFATSDHAFYRPYVRVDFYDMPWSFERQQSINPDWRSGQW